MDTKGSLEQRGAVIKAMLDMATGMMTEAMQIPNMEGLSVTVTQLCKLVLSTMAMQGFFKDPTLGAIYRDKSKGSWQKFLEIGGCFMASLMVEPAFHQQFGDEIDNKLWTLRQAVNAYFDPAVMLASTEEESQ